MKLTKLIIFQIIVGILFAFFYTKLTLPKFDEFKTKILDIRGSRSFQLPVSGTYLLKIFGDDIPEKVYFNSNRAVHSIFRNRAKLKEFYYIISPENSKMGTNTLLIIPDARQSIAIKNNIVLADFGAVLFKTTVTKKEIITLLLFLSFTLIFTAWGLAIFYLLQFLFGLSLDGFFVRYCLSYFPSLLLLYVFTKVSLFLPVKLLFFEKSYLGIVACLILIFQIPALFNFIIREIVYRYHHSEHSGNPRVKTIKSLGLDYTTIEYKHIYLEFLKIAGKNTSKQLLGYKAVAWFLNKEFSDKCVLLFMALLFSCAILLSFNLSIIAEFLANVAYLALVTGVIIKLKKARTRPNEGDSA